VLCDSLVENDGVFIGDSTIKLKPEETVLGLEPGDAVRLTEDDFRQLADGCLAEVEARYS